MKSLEKLLKPGERIDWSGYPWPRPEVGDRVRCVLLFDQDPGKTLSGYHLQKRVSNGVVWRTEGSASGNGWFSYVRDDEGLALPEIYSVYDHGGASRWGEVLIHLGASTPRFIPLHAIREGLLSPLARRLAQRTGLLEAGVCP